MLEAAPWMLTGCMYVHMQTPYPCKLQLAHQSDGDNNHTNLTWDMRNKQVNKHKALSVV